MAETKKKLLGKEKKKKYRSDGTPVWEKRSIDGPGVWVSCVKGKEKQTVGELYDLFESLADELWPEDISGQEEKTASTSEELSLEAQIANEMSSLQKSRREKRFASCQTNTPCVVFLSCKPPVDPVQLVVRHIENVQRTGVTQTRHTHRFVPVSGSSVANLPEIKSLCHDIFNKFFETHKNRSFTYKVELRMRNHSTISRSVLIQHIAQCVPAGHTVSLDNPEIFILVEVFKSVCGISIVQDYYRLQKFNVMEIANAKQRSEPSNSDSRVPD
ncbi:hypothetical protein AGABI2DRAFT_218712 [Agaricus bisporus var. bisporus H97]|uniref:hypothetical protein n=1 Tax=Agaricus bisporus var. bisporus (strain H97 / ATCC MYA-4626 / FGSC 10389) TaxID=936046 RepID=UPI00029F74FF|nr:hypothetical protein AGABI2DRAFT_218712 [Agaricus bisporus var. bisporus H97]EKV49391.1 hypothetical protein AGABI2DRAFT_218712 [Agaricus bisporus var. bisporus H97]